MNDTVKKTLVKVDLVGSTSFFNKIIDGSAWTLERVISELQDAVKKIFPDASTFVPQGSFVRAEGDAVLLAIDKPTVALRCAIELQKFWAGHRTKIPDIRVIIHSGELSISYDIAGHVALTGLPLAKVAKMEKMFSSGDIGITSEVKSAVDSSIFSFRRGPDLVDNEVSETWRVIFNDPRLLRDSAIAHAFFIANPESDRIRERAVEALIVDILLAKTPNKASQSEINDCFKAQGLPRLPSQYLIDITNKSSSLEMIDELLCLRTGAVNKINEYSKILERNKMEAVEIVFQEIQAKIKTGASEAYLKEKIAKMIEQYLFAIFLELRMMANYFKSAGQLFERLAESPEFDYIIRENLPDISNKQELLTQFRNIFLRSLKNIAPSNNGYVAAIFHNVLLLYYLNRNDEMAAGVLANLGEKRIFLDTNSLYALRIPSMSFHEELKYAIERFQALKAKICVFDISVNEYNQSLDAAMKNYSSGRIAYLSSIGKAPPIWTQYAKNPQQYLGMFENCVNIFRIPKSQGVEESFDDSASRDLGKHGIEFVKLSNFCQREQLGEIYDDVHTAKDQKERAPEVNGDANDFFDERVLHDANCLFQLKSAIPVSPTTAKDLFVTCDFYLARIRQKRSRSYDFVLTAPEFYELMLPYLFSNNEQHLNPVSWPNSMFALLISAEENRAPALSSTFGAFLDDGLDIQDYQIMAAGAQEKKFLEVKNKFRDAHFANDKQKAAEEYLVAVTAAYTSYENDVEDAIGKSIESEEISGLREEVNRIKLEMEKLRSSNEALMQKARGRAKALRRSRKTIAKK